MTNRRGRSAAAAAPSNEPNDGSDIVVAVPDELQTLRDEETRLQKILEIREMEKRVQRLQALTEEEVISQMSDRSRSSIEREDSGNLVDQMEEPPTRAPISLSVFTDTDKTDQFRSVSVRCSSELITDQTFLSVN
jgi:hypothetical protein